MKSVKDKLTKELLLSILKPARYIGAEIGSVKKDLSRIAVKVCLCFPDVYEIGMSHLGLRILYDLINRQKDFAAERVFSPWVDMEEKLKVERIPLFSLESAVPVGEFDILGFSLQYELSYTNVLNVLSLAGIPLESRGRTQKHPLVIAGGICALNPEPMADFIDLFIIGEAEEVMLEILNFYKKYKVESGCSKSELLKLLSGIQGVYIPSYYRIEDKTGARIVLDSHAPEKIHKCYIKDLNQLAPMETWIVPYIEIVHDRVGIEIMRGCPNNCRFCQARNYFTPFRILKKENVLKTVRYLSRKTGYEEVSLLSLSSSDHPDLCEMTQNLLDEFKDQGVGISLPSLKAKNQIGRISQVLSSVKKTALTFAPETGSERLRKMVNKNLKIDELFSVVQDAYRAGYRLLKLYFMIGLPTETWEDLDEIVQLCAKISWLRKDFDGHPAHLNVSISSFVPKSHTPFQWQAMNDLNTLTEKQEYLKKAFHRFSGVVRLKFHDAKMSFLEGVLARGDRRLCGVIKTAFEKGAKFDAWSQFFNLSLWLESFSDNAIDPHVYLKSKSYEDFLSWDFIDTGITRKTLETEAQRASFVSTALKVDSKSVDPNENI